MNNKIFETSAKDVCNQIATSVFLCLFLFQIIILFCNSNYESISFVELLKVIGPVVSVAVVSMFSNVNKIRFLKVMLFVLGIHILLGILISSLSTEYHFFSDDMRLLLLPVGRGAGETGWAIAVFLLTYFVLSKNHEFALNKKLNLVILIIGCGLIFMTQSRASIIFLIVALLAIGVRTALNAFFIFTTLGIMNVGIAYCIKWFNNLGEPEHVHNGSLVVRSLNQKSVLTGREYIWDHYLEWFYKLSLNEQLFGSDLVPKIKVIPEIGYITSDPHNFFLDIVQYFGIFGLIYILTWYIAILRKGNKSWDAVLISFAGIGFVVSTIRYPYLSYTNVMLLIVPSISFKRKHI